MISWNLPLGKMQIISMGVFFASKCTPLNNGSTLLHPVSNTPTVECPSFQFNDQDILKIIRALHVNKVNGCDNSYDKNMICMIKF